MTLPRVTEILAVIADPDWDAFKESVGEDRFRDVLNHAAERGTAFHKLIENYLNGLLDRSDLPAIYEKNHDFGVNLEAFMAWADDKIIRVIATEERLEHKLGFTGMPDIVVEMKGEKYALLDVKYVSVLSAKAAYQTAAYMKMAEKTYKIKIDYRAAMQFGKIGMRVIEYRDHATDWGVFLSAFNIYNAYIKRRKHGKK